MNELQPAAQKTTEFWSSGLKHFGGRFLNTFYKTQRITVPVIAALIALIIGGLLIASSGSSAAESYTVLVRGAFGSLSRLGYTIGQMVPLVFTGLAVAVAYQGGVFNLGGQGQLLMGGIGATLVSISFPNMPPVIHIPMAILAAALFGMIWAYIPGIMKAKLGVTAVITTLMFNYIADAIMEWAVRGPLQGAEGGVPASRLIYESARIPMLGGSGISSSILIALVTVLFIYILLYRTTVGFSIRCVGLNPVAGVYAGIRSSRTIMTSMLLSGALAGMAGGIEILATTFRLWESLLHGYGFTGITVALVGGLHPVGVLIAALFFGALRSGANSMQVLMRIPVPIVFIIQALTILFVVAGTAVRFHGTADLTEGSNVNDPSKSECEDPDEEQADAPVLDGGEGDK